MSNIDVLEKQREQILNSIRAIETLEGVENEENSKLISELNLQKAKVGSHLNEESARLNALRYVINKRISNLSGSAIDKILEAIKEQRWYFFKNKPKVLMDRNTGLLWANLDYFPYCKEDGNYCDEDIYFF